MLTCCVRSDQNDDTVPADNDVEETRDEKRQRRGQKKAKRAEVEYVTYSTHYGVFVLKAHLFGTESNLRPPRM
jgi:hypothetical protein